MRMQMFVVVMILTMIMAVMLVLGIELLCYLFLPFIDVLSKIYGLSKRDFLLS